MTIDYDKHVETFKKFRSGNFQKLNRASTDFFGDPFAVPKPLDKIVDDLNKVTAFAGNLSSKITDEITPQYIINISLSLSSGKETWTTQNKIIKHTAAVTGIHKLSVLSAAPFKIFTKLFLLRHDADNDFSGVVSVVINQRTEETFTLEPENEALTSATYYYNLEFIAEAPQLV